VIASDNRGGTRPEVSRSIIASRHLARGKYSNIRTKRNDAFPSRKLEDTKDTRIHLNATRLSSSSFLCLSADGFRYHAKFLFPDIFLLA